MTTNAATGVSAAASGNIGRLAIAQALGGANANVVYATGAIVGSQLAPDPSLVTFPISLFVVGMASGTLPTGYISRRHGRRAAFLIGATLGVLAGLIGLLAVLRGSFALFCVATFVAGVYSAVVQSFRFAATDGAPPLQRARAISWVMVGGLVGGVIGPQMIQLTMNLWQPYLFAASFIGQSAFALASMGVLAGVDLRKPAAAELASGRPLLEIVATPKFAIAALCGVVSYALMNLVMTSAPLAMRLCGLSLSVGWNFGFVGASAMVVETHRPEERNKVQSFNDFVIFGTMALGSFSSGKLLTSFGWDAVNWVAFPPISIALAALLGVGLLRARVAS